MVCAAKKGVSVSLGVVSYSPSWGFLVFAVVVDEGWSVGRMYLNRKMTPYTGLFGVSGAPQVLLCMRGEEGIPQRPDKIHI